MYCICQEWTSHILSRQGISKENLCPKSSAECWLLKLYRVCFSQQSTPASLQTSHLWHKNSLLKYIKHDLRKKVKHWKTRQLCILTQILCCLGVKDAKFLCLFLELWHFVIGLIFHIFFHCRKQKCKCLCFATRYLTRLYSMLINQNVTLTASSATTKAK